MKWKTWKKFGVIAMAVIMGAAFLAGCGSDNSSSSSANKKELTYSKSQGPYSDLFEKGIKPILEKKGYKVNVLLNGLGEHPAIQELFIQHVKFATKHQREDITVKKKKYEKTDDID